MSIPTVNSSGSEHPLVTKVVGEPTDPKIVTPLVGFEGRAIEGGFIRIYRTHDFDVYFHVEEADVVYRKAVDDQLGSTVFWIKSTARITLRSRTAEAVAKGASFLVGEISERAIADHRAIPSSPSPLMPPTQSTLRICKSITLECASDYCGGL